MRKLVKKVFTLMAAAYAALSPTHVSAQGQQAPLATYHFREYSLGVYTPVASAVRIDQHLKEMEGKIAADTTTEIDLVGYADATPWGSCKTLACTDNKNQVLAELRASLFARKITTMYGINPSRIKARGEVTATRGGVNRGVTIYIRHRQTNAQIVRESATSKELDSLRLVVAALRDSFGIISGRISSVIVTTQKNSTSIDALEKRPFLPPIPQNTVVQNIPMIGVDVGAGLSAVQTNGIDALAPTVSLFIKPRGSPVEYFLDGGLRPNSSHNVCNRADVVGSLGANVKIFGPLGATLGAFTAREMCTNGGPKLNERWLDRTNGVFVGPALNISLLGVTGTLNPALTWSSTYRAQPKTGTTGFGTQVRFNIRTKGNGRKE